STCGGLPHQTRGGKNLPPLRNPEKDDVTPQAGAVFRHIIFPARNGLPFASISVAGDQKRFPDDSRLFECALPGVGDLRPVRRPAIAITDTWFIDEGSLPGGQVDDAKPQLPILGIGSIESRRAQDPSA